MKIKLAILLVCILGAAFYTKSYLSQSKTDNQTLSQKKSNWINYDSQSLGFSFQYPQDWELHKSPNFDMPFNLSSTRYPSTLPQGDGNIFFFSVENKGNLDLDTWVKKNGHNSGRLPDTAYIKTYLGGLPAIEIKYEWNSEFENWLKENYPNIDWSGHPPNGSNFREIDVLYKNNIIQIQTLFVNSDNYPMFIQEVDGILSTIRFTDSQ